MYSSALTEYSSKYSRTSCEIPNHYYEAIQVNVATTGYYTLSSQSNIDTYGYLYRNSFSPSNPSMNLILENIHGCDNNQFKLASFLESDTNYILVVTTAYTNLTGAFSIIISGPNNATVKRISELITTNRSIVINTPKRENFSNY